MKILRGALLASLYALAGIAGIRSALLRQERQLTDLVLGLSFAFVVSQLCSVDSRLIQRPLSHAAQWIMFFTWPLTAPIYMLWSRRVKGLLVLLLHIVLLYGVWYASALLAWRARTYEA